MGKIRKLVKNRRNKIAKSVTFERMINNLKKRASAGHIVCI